MNWGRGIAIFFSAFVVFILFMVYLTSRHDHELIYEDYYQQEVSYQDVLEGDKNLKSLGQNVEILQRSGEIQIKFPNKALENFENGKLWILRLSDKRFDVEVEWSGEELVTIAKTEMIAGRYLIRADWKGDKPYHFEQNYLVK